MPNVKSVLEVAVDSAGYAATREILNRLAGGMVKKSSGKEVGYYALADLVYVYGIRGSGMLVDIYGAGPVDRPGSADDEMQKSMSIFLMLMARDLLMSKEKFAGSLVDNAIAVFGAGVVNNWLDSVLPMSLT